MAHRAIFTAVLALSSLGMAQTSLSIENLTQASVAGTPAIAGASLAPAASGGGWRDVITSDPANNQVFLRPGCDLSIERTYTGPVGNRSFGLTFALGDLNGDGGQEIVISMQASSAPGGFQVYDLITGIFCGAIEQPLGGSGNFADNLLIADLDGDGNPEIITTFSTARTINGRNTGWVGIYDGASLELRNELEGTTAGGNLGQSLAVATWPGRTNPVLLVGEPGDNFGNGRVCVLDSSLNFVTEISWPFADGHIGSGPIGQAADGQIVICSPSASFTTSTSCEGSLNIYAPATGMVTFTLDGAPPNETKLGSSFAFGPNGTLLVIKSVLGIGALFQVDPSTGSVDVLADDVSRFAKLYEHSSANVFNDGKTRYLLGQPTQNMMFHLVVPDMRGDRTVASRGESVKFTVDLGPIAAGGTFFPFASLTGDGPVDVFGLTLALTVDASLRGPELFSASPVLDADGRGCFTLPIPAGISTGVSVKVWVSGVLVKNGQLVDATSTSTNVTVNL